MQNIQWERQRCRNSSWIVYKCRFQSHCVGYRDIKQAARRDRNFPRVNAVATNRRNQTDKAVPFNDGVLKRTADGVIEVSCRHAISKWNESLSRGGWKSGNENHLR